MRLFVMGKGARPEFMPYKSSKPLSEHSHDRPRRRSSSGGGGFRFTQIGPWIVEHPLAVGLILTLVFALLAEMPWLSNAVRAHVLLWLFVAFLALVVSIGTYQEDLRRAALRGPNPWILGLLGWCVVSALLAPFRTYAVAELLRMFLCAVIYFAAAYGLRASELRPVVFAVLALGTAVALSSIVEFGMTEGSGLGSSDSIFGNHEQYGSFIALLLTVAAAFALDRSGDPKVLLSVQAATLLLGAGLLLARTRSAWAGELLGLVTLTALVLRYSSTRLTRTNRFVIVGPFLLLSLGFALLMFSDQFLPLLSQRAATFARVVDDVSFADRLHRWHAACQMTYERPVAGWGLGSFPVIQSRWTGQGDPPASVLVHGTGHSNLAHNFWVQWAAETGSVGLMLYVGMIFAFLLSTGRQLKTMRPGFPRTLLIGCLAATVTACGDMVGAPSYTFPGVSAFAWLWMGLGVAACRAAKEDIGEGDSTLALPATPRVVWAVSLTVGFLAALTVILVGAR